jgi:hypothetical protein
MTNWFEQYYSDFIEFASRIIIAKELPIDPADLVNDAYIKFYESGEEFSVGKIKTLISGGSWKEVNEVKAKNTLGQGFTKAAPKIQGDRTCSCCHEVKQVNEYHFKRFKGFSYLRTMCKKCVSKRNLKYLQDHREQWNAYMKKRRPSKKKPAKPIQELWNKANKKRYAKEKELLLDSYVRRILKAQKKPFGPKEIEQKRQELFEKRRMKAA